VSQGARILVVEDEPAVCFFLEKALRRAGHAVTSLPCAEEALAWLERQSPDLLLVDLQLGALSGLDLLEVVRGFAHPIPALVLSAHDSRENARQALELGAVDFVPKPCTIEDLCQAVAWALGGGREARRQALADCLACRPDLSVAQARRQAFSSLPPSSFSLPADRGSAGTGEAQERADP
jgi:DNA-binding response OmpR family regulator